MKNIGNGKRTKWLGEVNDDGKLITITHPDGIEITRQQAYNNLLQFGTVTMLMPSK